MSFILPHVVGHEWAIVFGQGPFSEGCV